MSFFDEDDEPTRRTPRPRRAAPAGGDDLDSQTLWTRRAVAAGIGLLLFVLAVVGVKACVDSSRKNGLRDYNREAGAIVAQSDNDVGAPFFETLGQAASQSPEDLQTQISGLRATADTNLKQARKLSTPGELESAQQSLLEALELRRNGLQFIAARTATALGNESDVANQAIEAITGEMQAFLASDVLIRRRVTPLITDALKSNDVVAEPLRTKGFLPGFSWLQPAYVADQLGTRLTSTGGSGGSGGGGQSGPIAPGLHGNGLTSTEINGTTLQPDPAENRVTIDGDVSLSVTFVNQGENDEVDVPVQVTVQPESGKDITGKGSVDLIAQGESQTVDIPLSAQPSPGLYTVSVEVKAVPGEEKTDNNKSSYNVLFE